MATLIFTLAALLLLTRMIQGAKSAEMARLTRSAAGAVRQALPSGGSLSFHHRREDDSASNYVVVPCESEFGIKGQTFRLQRAS